MTDKNIKLEPIPATHPMLPASLVATTCRKSSAASRAAALAMRR